MELKYFSYFIKVTSLVHSDLISIRRPDAVDLVMYDRSMLAELDTEDQIMSIDRNTLYTLFQTFNYSTVIK